VDGDINQPVDQHIPHLLSDESLSLQVKRCWR